MKTMAFEAVGPLVIVVHTADPPSQADWDRYIAESKRGVERFGQDRARHLIFTGGGGPSFSQRQQVNEFLRGRPSPTAVVTTNAFARGIVAALAVFNPKIKAFRPEAIGEAFRYLGISEADSKVVWRTVARLQAQIGFGGARSAG
jgi:hypothetical protein